MTTNPNWFVFGTVNGSHVLGDLNDLCKEPMTIKLTAAYTMAAADLVTGEAVLMRPFMSSPGSQAQNILPQTWASGTIMTLHAPEALALINAGAATLIATGFNASTLVVP